MIKHATSVALLLTVWTTEPRTIGTGAGVPAPQREPRSEAIFPFPVHQRTLPNRLQVIAIPYESPGIVSLYIVVRTGSRDEVEPGHSGFAHFFEHMMFRGTEQYSPAEYNDVLKRLGADANASTWDDRTVYHMTGPAAGFDTMVALEADRFQNLKYSEEAFRTEALAVLGEYNKAASNPFLALEERLREVAFTTHSYRHTTLGFLEDIKRMPEYYEYGLAFFARFYRPDNVTVLAVGDVDPEHVFGTIARHFGDWQPGYEPPAVPEEPPQRQRRSAHVEWPQPTRPYLMLGYHTPPFSTAAVDYAALDVIAELLFSDAAPLHQLLVVERQWADFVQGGAEDHRDAYLFTVAARVKSSELVQKTRAAIDEHVAALQRTPVDPARLKRVQSHLRYRFALSLDTPDAIADTVSHYVGLTGSVETINELFRRYQEIAPADVQRVARSTFRPDNETIVTLDGPPGRAGGERR